MGIAEQSAEMFSSPAWQDLRLKRVRYLVPWDWDRTEQEAEVVAFMAAARARRQDVLVTFTAHRGCFVGRRYSRSNAWRAPGAKAYRAAFRRFDDQFPWVRTYAAWNEVNHISQPTFRSPQLAVGYYRVLRRESRRRRFRVMAADMLDTSNMRRYVRSFLRQAPGRPRLRGAARLPGRQPPHLRRRTHAARDRAGRGLADGDERRREGRQQPAVRLLAVSRRAAHALDLPARGRYDSRRRGLRSRITRLFVYQWFGAPRDASFDAGLVDLGGTPRAAYYVVKRYARSRR